MGGSVPAGDTFGELFLVLLALALLLFLLPVFIAFGRRHPNRWPILILTIALGATLFGWLVALIWALDWENLRDRRRSESDDDEFDDEYGDEVDECEHEHGTPRLTVVQTHVDEPTPDIGLAGSRFDASWATEQIERLVRLKDRGHIDADEFEGLKAAVFDRVRVSNGSPT